MNASYLIEQTLEAPALDPVSLHDEATIGSSSRSASENSLIAIRFRAYLPRARATGGVVARDALAPHHPEPE
jgi:hypothetical protein